MKTKDEAVKIIYDKITKIGDIYMGDIDELEPKDQLFISLYVELAGHTLTEWVVKRHPEFRKDIPEIEGKVVKLMNIAVNMGKNNK